MASIGLLILNLYYLASILTNTNNILKIDLCYLAKTLINIDNKADNFIKKRLVMSKWLLISCYWVMFKDNNFISQ